MVRGLQDFVDKIDADLQWRKHELSTLKLEIQRANSQHRRRVLCRSAICLLYSHWEGFIKKSSDMYLSLIEYKGLSLSDLRIEYSSISLFGALKSCAQSNKITSYTSAVGIIISNNSERFRVGSFKFEIEGNLNYERLYEMLFMTGYKGNVFETNRAFIDEKLLSKRNNVAHGENMDVSKEDYVEIHDRILSLIEEFRDHIQNCAALESYKR